MATVSQELKGYLTQTRETYGQGLPCVPEKLPLSTSGRAVLMVTMCLGVTLHLYPHHLPRWDISGLAVTSASRAKRCLYDLPNWKLTLKVEASVAGVTVLSFPDSHRRLKGFTMLSEFKGF